MNRSKGKVAAWEKCVPGLSPLVIWPSTMIVMIIMEPIT